jgi:hypothetical protein
MIYIETAFLHGDFEESIFMEIPRDIGLGDNKCLALKKTIYVLVQSSRKFYIKLFKALKSCGFTKRLVDPCLLVKQSNKEYIDVNISVQLPNKWN